MKIAVCNECGEECYFQAIIDYSGAVVETWKEGYCTGCDTEIKRNYTIKDERSLAGMVLKGIEAEW